MKRILSCLISLLCILFMPIGVWAQTSFDYDRISFEKEIDWVVPCAPEKCVFGTAYDMVSAFDITEPYLTFHDLKQTCDRRLVLIEYEKEVIGAASFVLQDGIYLCDAYENLRPYAREKLLQLEKECVIIIDQETTVLTQDSVKFLTSADTDQPNMNCEDYLLCVSCENAMREMGERWAGQKNLGRYDEEDLQFAQRFWRFPQLYGRKITSAAVYGTIGVVIALTLAVRLWYKARSKKRGASE